MENTLGWFVVAEVGNSTVLPVELERVLYCDRCYRKCSLLVVVSCVKAFAAALCLPSSVGNLKGERCVVVKA